MVNVIIGTILLVVSTYIGIKIDSYYKERSNIIKEWLEFLQESNKQIKYFKTDIISIMARCEQQRIAKVVGEIKEQLTENTAIEVDSVYLNDKEKEIIIRYFKGVIGCDIAAQTTLAECTEQDMERQIGVAERQKKEKGELIKKLMILLGVALLIIVL